MTTVSPDCELVAAYATEGCETAFRSLVARHVDLVYATALRQVGEPGIAEEIAQNVFVVLARKAPRLAGAQTLAGWLHRTTILEAKARIRAELRRRRRDQIAAELALIEREGAPALDALAPLLDEGLLNLREPERLALVLRFLEERSLREVGEVLGVDEDAARKRVARALDRLAEFFKARGFVVSGGAAVILTNTTKAAAPAALALSAGNAGLAAATGSVTTFNWLLFHFMSLTKTQTAALCVVLATAPLVLQWQTERRITREQRELSSALANATSSADALNREVQSTREATLRIQNESINFQARTKILNEQRTGQMARPVYRWDDNSSVVRVPKKFLEMIPVSSVSRLGVLTEGIKELLQLTNQETAQVQSALNQFLSDYTAAQTARMRAVVPEADELDGHSGEEVRAFELGAIGEGFGALRAKLLSSLQASLGPDRFGIFKKTLETWMPLDDEFHGLNSGRVVFNVDRRECFYRPEPGARMITRQFSSKEAMGMMSMAFETAEIPELYRPLVQDWIALAESRRAAGKGTTP